MANIEFRVGELIENRYRVLSVIGSGGMGILYRVSDEAKDGEVVALKTVRMNIPTLERSESVERFQREFQILTHLRHPNLVSVYNYGITTEGKLYFTMEWVQGQDLESHMRRLEPTTIIPVMVQICRALAYLHARGVIHGDLKPSNVLMADDQAKIADFGLALEAGTSEVQPHYYTPGYTAPEVRRRHPSDHRADLYSLGAIWYTLLVGEPPMFLPSQERLIKLTLDKALKDQEEIPAEIGPVISRLLATSPAKRYISANEVIAAVNEATGSAYALETRETAISYALRGRFVGREAEMKMLQTAWEQAQSNEGRLVLVSGEAGVGKTRLVEEFIVQAELEGIRVARGQCVEIGGSAYRPWREVLRVLIRYVEGADGVTLKQAGPVLATLLPELWERDYMAGLAPPADLEYQAAQLRLNNAISQILRAAAEIRPTAVVIEDAHWADEATLELLNFLARVPGPAGLLVCVTYRDDESGPARSLDALSGSRVGHIPLRSLSPEIATDLVCSMLGLEEMPALLTERVHQTTGGNAFFVQELVRSLAEDGVVLQRTVTGWQVDRAALREARLPESIRQVVWQRLEHLSVETQQVLRWAAIAGEIFWDGVLEEIGHIPRAQVQAALAEGLEKGLIFERETSAFEGEREFLFAKPAVQEVSYESFSPGERRRVHSRVAAWLMAHSDEQVAEHLGLIADHLEGVGQTEQAVTYLTRAGKQAAEQFANAEAIAYLSRALDLTPEDEWGRRYDLLLAREKVYDLQGMRGAQIQDLAALEELADALADNQRRAEAALRQARYAEATGDYAAAIAAARATTELARAAQDASKEAAGYQQWGFALWRQGEYETAQLQLEQALTLARATGVRQASSRDFELSRIALSRAVEADSLRDLGVISSLQGDLVGAIAYSEQALCIYHEMGNRRDESAALNNMGAVFAEQGDYAEARVYFERTLHIAREIGHRQSECLALGNVGFVSVGLGDYTEARTYFEQALGIAREIDDRGVESTTLANLGQFFHLLGDDESAREYNQRALLIAQDIGDRRQQGYALTNLGHALAGLSRLTEAAHAYQRALDIRRELGEHNPAMESLAGLARVSLAQRDLTQAQVHAEEILSHLEANTPSTGASTELGQVSGHGLDGTDEPFRVYLTCYRVLRANRDPRAEAILHTAHGLLQEQAAKISDEKMRRSFLENVAAHREIVSEFAEKE